MTCKLTSKRASAAASSVAALSLLAAGCSQKDKAAEGEAEGEETEEAAEEEDKPKLLISGIPDQEVAHLNRQHELVAEYIGEQTGLEAEYVPMNDYAALVTTFERGDVHLAWFGGLTGVQARNVTEGAQAIAQRARDAEFHSEFIVQADLEVESLEDLKGKSFTFGSESSTSGHLMPRHFLTEAGINPDEDLDGPPNYSGSHDKTLELVQSGAYQAGALNQGVFEKWKEEGKLEEEKVRVFYTTPAYYDYNWTIRGDLDETFGEGTAQKIQDAFVALDASNEDHKELLDMFQAEKFIETNNDNYGQIEQVAKDLGMIR